MLALTLTLLLLGLTLLAVGLRGRRIGDEPRCRKCKYNLTGVESKTCPECGRTWTPDSAARGLRIKRKRPLAIGAALLLLGSVLTAGLTTGYLQRTNWFTRLPTNWIIPFAARGNTDAFTVLADRFDNGKLTPTNITQIIEAALSVQADPQLRATTQDWIELLARLEARGTLTTQQRDRYYSQMVTLDLAIRRPLSRADYIEGEVHKRWRAPNKTYLIWQFEAKSATLDGHPLHLRPTIFGQDTNYVNVRGSRGYYDASDPLIVGPFTPASPGSHTIEFKCRSEFRPLTSRTRKPIWEGEQTLRSTIEIADSKKPLPVAPTGDPRTIQRVIDSLEFTVTIVPGGRGDPRRLFIDWQLTRPAPCDAWIEIRTRPRRGRLAGFFDFDKTIYLPQGVQHEVLTELGSFESSKFAPGDKLTLWLYSEDRDNSRSGVGTTRLKPGILLGQVQVPIQPNTPPTTPRATGS